jgi:hypothetical protein
VSVHRVLVRSAAALAVVSIVFAGVSPALAQVGSIEGQRPAMGVHPDVAPVTASLISGGSGTNTISFANFDDGDIVVVQDPWSITGHAGLFDERFYSSIRSFAVLSANTSPADGVQREQCLKYRSQDRAWGLWVPSVASYGAAARNFAYRQMGKPYNIFAAKTDLSSFYCSKLAWAAWRYTAGVDLDADGGYWVWPVDLINSPRTRVFGYWS